jgi:hypothetical protein
MLKPQQEQEKKPKKQEGPKKKEDQPGKTRAPKKPKANVAEESKQGPLPGFIGDQTQLEDRAFAQYQNIQAANNVPKRKRGRPSKKDLE